MRISRGLSWTMSDGTWRKENIDVDLDDLPIPEDLVSDAHRLAWASIEVEIQLLTLRWFYGGMPTDVFEGSVESLRTTQGRLPEVIPL